MRLMLELSCIVCLGDFIWIITALIVQREEYTKTLQE